MRMRPRRAGLLPVSLMSVGVLVASGCSSGSPAASRHIPATTGVATSTVVPSTTTSTSPPAQITVPASTSTVAGGSGLGPCRAVDLSGSFSVIPGSAGAGHVAARVVLTNKTSSPCRTYGYVGMQLLGASGQPLPTNVVRQKATPQELVLGPGQSASALATYSPDVPGAGDQSGPQCQPVAKSAEITPPGDTRFLVVSGPGTPVCERGTIDLGPLEPGADAGAPAGG